jgi:hypothetical protein
MPLDYSQIGPYLYLGESPKNEDDYILMADSFDAVFEFNNQEDLGEKKLIKIFGGDSERRMTQAEYQQQQVTLQARLQGFRNQFLDKNITFWHYYLDDKEGRGMAKIFAMAYEKFRVERGLPSCRIYVHCKSGVHRSAHFLIYTLMMQGLSYDDAFQFLQHKRNKIEVRPELKDQLLTLFHEVNSR